MTQRPPLQPARTCTAGSRPPGRRHAAPRCCFNDHRCIGCVTSHSQSTCTTTMNASTSRLAIEGSLPEHVVLELGTVGHCRRNPPTRARIPHRLRSAPMSLEHTTALVTGGASGMGEATARRLAAEGAHVVDRRPRRGQGRAGRRRARTACSRRPMSPTRTTSTRRGRGRGRARAAAHVHPLRGHRLGRTHDQPRRRRRTTSTRSARSSRSTSSARSTCCGSRRRAWRPNEPDDERRARA